MHVTFLLENTSGRGRWGNKGVDMISKWILKK